MYDFAAVYEQHVSSVYGFFAYRLRSREAAEDLTQLTFERSLKAWERYDPAKSRPVTWLLAIARNLLIDHLRAEQEHTQQRPLDDAALGLATDADHVHGLSPELERALGGLDDRARELLALRYGVDLTGPEIANLTGLSLANVQQILSRSLRTLRVLLDA